jgi:RND family efflux transporter MFP subunit
MTTRWLKTRRPLPRFACAFKGGVRCVWLVLLAVFMVPVTAQAGPAKSGAAPPTVRVAAVREADISPVSEYVGHVEAVQAVDLRARVEGFLEAVRFKEGDRVSAGEVLYEIEPAAFRARVQAARAGVAAAEAELKRAEARLKRLHAALPESVPATDMDNAMAAEQTAQANLSEAEAARTLAELDLSYATIKAPISGRIGRTRYTRGNLVNPNSGVLARIVQIDPIRVAYAISENDLIGIQKALADADRTRHRMLAPLLRLADGSIFDQTGRVSFVDNQVDPSTGTIAVRAEFANPDGLLIPDQYVTVRIKSETARLMPLVPQSAVLIGKEGRSVLMVVGGVVTSRPITTGQVVGTDWAVESGLKAGEKIIVSGIQKVRPGKPATAVPADSGAEGAP